jgi:hypothetical protein
MFRVDVMLPHDAYAEYTSRKGVDFGMATALGNYLKWRKAGGRIVEVCSGNVIEEWPRIYIPAPTDSFRNVVADLRKAACL